VGVLALWGVTVVQRWRRGKKTASLEALFTGLAFTLPIEIRSLYLLNLFPRSAQATFLGLTALCILFGAIVEWRRWRQATTSRQRSLAILLFSSLTAFLLTGVFNILVPVSMGRPA
jgi:hypothetical protein